MAVNSNQTSNHKVLNAQLNELVLPSIGVNGNTLTKLYAHY